MAVKRWLLCCFVINDDELELKSILTVISWSTGWYGHEISVNFSNSFCEFLWKWAYFHKRLWSSTFSSWIRSVPLNFACIVLYGFILGRHPCYSSFKILTFHWQFYDLRLLGYCSCSVVLHHRQATFCSLMFQHILYILTAFIHMNVVHRKFVMLLRAWFIHIWSTLMIFLLLYVFLFIAVTLVILHNSHFMVYLLCCYTFWSVWCTQFANFTDFMAGVNLLSLSYYDWDGCNLLLLPPQSGTWGMFFSGISYFSGERLYERTVKHIKWTKWMPLIVVNGGRW